MISLCPGLLPTDSNFVRTSPPIHTIPNIAKIGKTSNQDLILPAKNFLLNYLKTIRAVDGNSFIHILELDTAIVKLLTEISPSELVEFLKQDRIFCSYEGMCFYYISENGTDIVLLHSVTVVCIILLYCNVLCRMC